MLYDWSMDSNHSTCIFGIKKSVVCAREGGANTTPYFLAVLFASQKMNPVGAESEGAAEFPPHPPSAAPERKIEAKPAALLVQSRTQQKSFLFLLEEKIGRAQNQKCRENFFAGWRAVASGGGLASLVGFPFVVGSRKVYNYSTRTISVIKDMKIRIKRFNKKFPLPQAEEGAACFDLICRESVTIPPGKIKAVAQNIAVKIPADYALLLFSRSSTSHKVGLMLANGVGVTDPFYCGDKDENFAFLLNITDKAVIVKAGDKIVQGMIIKTEQVSWQEVDAMNEEGHGG